MISDNQNGKLSEALQQELLQMPDVQGGLWKKQRYAAAIRANHNLPGIQSQSWGRQRSKLEDERFFLREEMQLDEEGENDDKIPEGGNDHLLILAQSAELMSESTDSFHGVHLKDQNHEGSQTTLLAEHLLENVSNTTATDSDKNGNKLDGMLVVVHGRSEKDGSLPKGKGPRLSQIRHQARSKNLSLVPEKVELCADGHLQGRKTRLTQIRHQARSKNHALLQIENAGCPNGHLKGGITRLTQVRCQARSKYNMSVQEENVEPMQRCLDLNICEVDVEAEDRRICVKGRVRLSQLKRKARLENAYSVAVRHDGILNSGDGNCNVDLMPGLN